MMSLRKISKSISLAAAALGVACSSHPATSSFDGIDAGVDAAVSTDGGGDPGLNAGDDGGGPPSLGGVPDAGPPSAGGCAIADPNADQDHDGWSPNQGDCNDCDPNVNPG